MDVSFFDPESTAEVARHSFSESHLTSKDQESFRGFSFVAADASDLLKRVRRRGSSNSGNKSPKSPLSTRKITPPLSTIAEPLDVKPEASKEKPQKEFLSSHRTTSGDQLPDEIKERLNLHSIDGEHVGYSSDPSESESKRRWNLVLSGAYKPNSSDSIEIPKRIIKEAEIK